MAGTGVGNRGRKQGLETGVSIFGNWGFRHGKLVYACFLLMFWDRVSAIGNCGFCLWKLGFQFLETGVSASGNWGWTEPQMPKPRSA